MSYIKCFYKRMTRPARIFTLICFLASICCSASSFSSLQTDTDLDGQQNSKAIEINNRINHNSSKKTMTVPATMEDAEELAHLLNNFFQQSSDNPGHANNELDAVRRKLISLENKHVNLKFDPKILNDKELTNKLFELNHERFAGPLFKWLLHAGFVCMAYLGMCAGGIGPDPYPEIKTELPPPVRTRGAIQ